MAKRRSSKPSPEEISQAHTLPPLPAVDERGDELDHATRGWVYRQLDVLLERFAQQIAKRDELREGEARRRQDQRDNRVEELLSRTETTLRSLAADMAVLRHESQQTRLDIGRQATTISQILERVSKLEGEQRALHSVDEELGRQIGELKTELARHRKLLEDAAGGP